MWSCSVLNAKTCIKQTETSLYSLTVVAVVIVVLRDIRDSLIIMVELSARVSLVGGGDGAPAVR